MRIWYPTVLPHSTFRVTWRFDSPYAISYWWPFRTESLNPAVFRILRCKHIGVMSFTFPGHVTSSITWPFDSPYDISYWWSLGTESLYLQPFSRYCALSVLRSRVWPFKVMWRHRPRDHLIAHMPFPVGSPLERSLYLQPFLRYCAVGVLGSHVWLFRVTWPFESPYIISYWWSFGTMPLSLTAFEIFSVNIT